MSQVQALNQKAVTALLNDEVDQAIGLLVRQLNEIRHDEKAQNDVSPYPADCKANPAPNLPKMKPVSGKSKKGSLKDRALTVTCPTCEAHQGEPCLKMSGRGPGQPVLRPLTAKVDRLGNPDIHKTRIDLVR